MELNLNIFDIVVLTVILVSTIVGAFRGITTEFSSFLVWVLSAILTLLLAPHIAGWVHFHIYQLTIANIVAYVGCYAFFILVLFFTIKIISSLTQKVDKTTLDKVVGVLFGFLRGISIVSLLFLFIFILYKDDDEVIDMPTWYINSQFFTLLEFTSAVLYSVVPITENMIDKEYPEEKQDLLNIIQNSTNEDTDNINEIIENTEEQE